MISQPTQVPVLDSEPSGAPITALGIVVIGRNEGSRLVRCLESVGFAHALRVYVDSGSTDGSIDSARTLGADVVILDADCSFTAARARNAGFRRLRESGDQLRTVQFIDGDCEIEPGWLEAGMRVFERDPTCAVVCGLLRERQPEASIYNRLADLEWRRDCGEIAYCGGIFMVRADVFERVGMFDPRIAAGEEPDLCCRIRQAGFRIVRIDYPMATHDLHMTRFSQWWRRSVRGGYGALKLTCFGPEVSRGVFRRQVRSALAWGGGLPLAALLGTVLATVAGWWPWSLVVLTLWPTMLGLQVARLSARTRRQGQPTRVSVIHAGLTVLWKYAALVGFGRCLRDRMIEKLTARAVTREFHKTAA
jgi:hypothetical protein